MFFFHFSSLVTQGSSDKYHREVCPLKAVFLLFMLHSWQGSGGYSAPPLGTKVQFPAQVPSPDAPKLGLRSSQDTGSWWAPSSYPECSGGSRIPQSFTQCYFLLSLFWIMNNDITLVFSPLLFFISFLPFPSLTQQKALRIQARLRSLLPGPDSTAILTPRPSRARFFHRQGKLFYSNMVPPHTYND